jgi:hypothetical protein
MRPLNPRLHAALNRTFGNVKISNQGIPMSAVYMPGANGKKRLTPVLKGEYYVVACPNCHDIKGHFYVNHRWGVHDPVNGTRNLWLAHCFLCGYPNDWDDRLKLVERLSEYNIQAQFGAVSVPEVTQASPLTQRNLPADFELLSDLGPNHRACRYVRGRGFDFKELSRIWGVGYSMDAYRSSLGRLVIPLHAQLESDLDEREAQDRWLVVGYQGRSLHDEEPKYLTLDATPKSRLLYGLDKVPQDSDTSVIVCEGPTDVWRAGPGAVGLLGKSISSAQCKLLRETCPSRDVVVLLDPGAEEEAKAVAERLRRFLDRDCVSSSSPGTVVVAQLPDERDPAECSRKELWRVIERARCVTPKKVKKKRRC